MVILMALIAVPVLKLAVLLVMYQCVAAVMEPVCDKRLVNCVMAAAKGQKMMYHGNRLLHGPLFQGIHIRQYQPLDQMEPQHQPRHGF